MGNQNNVYVGVFRENTDPDKFFEDLTHHAKTRHLPHERMRFSSKGRDFSLECHQEIANLVRKQKEVSTFRCDKVYTDEEKKN